MESKPRLIFITGNSYIIDFMKNSEIDEKFELSFYDFEDFKGIGYEKDTPLYLDIDCIGEAELENIKKNGNTGENRWKYGIIDLNNTITDPTSLIFGGFFDYINHDLIDKGGLTVDRLESAIKFRNRMINFEKSVLVDLPVESEKEDRDRFINWEDIEEGEEYTFIMLYIQIDNIQHIIESYSIDYRREILGNFRKFVESIVADANGRLWMWNEHGGIVLFPFGNEKRKVLTSTLRLVMNKHIFGFTLENSCIVNYHVVLHIGKTVYRERGRTGTLISDDINKIFHIGADFSCSRPFCITGKVIEMLPDKLKRAFSEIGTFEGEDIYSFRYQYFNNDNTPHPEFSE